MIRREKGQMRRNAKRYIIAAYILACIMMFAGCSGNAALAQKEPQEGSTVYQLEGKCTAQVSEDQIVIYLHSNLLEGTAVNFCIDTYDGVELVSKVYAVSGETISATFDLDPSWKGKLVYASVVAAPSVGKQAENVTEAYGRYFQNIQGDCVIWNKSENIFMVQSDKITL